MTKISHAEGQAIVTRALPQATPKESLVVRALSGVESGYYGNGWKGAGVDSNNWGAITAGSWTGKTFQYEDFDWNPDGTKGKVTLRKFRAYPTPEDGAIDLYRIALKPNVKTAIALGDIVGISRAMKDNNYYGGDKIKGDAREKLIFEHAAKLRYHLGNVIGKTGEPDPFVSDPVSDPIIIPPKPETEFKYQLLFYGGILLVLYFAMLGPEAAATRRKFSVRRA